MGMAAISFVLYLLFVAAAICLMVAAVVLAGWATVWHGLGFALDWRVGLGFLGAGVVFGGAGYALYRLGRHTF
jgi:hypothetical protein